MKINLKKWVAIGLSMMSVMSMTVYGVEVEEQKKPVLSIEAAIESAYRNTSSLGLNSQQNTMLEEKLQTNLNQDGTYAAYQNLYIQLRENERNATYIKDQITYDVTTRYQNLINSQQEIDNLKKEIEVQTKSLNQMKLQYEKGLISKLQYESAQLELENLKTSLTTKSETLESDKSYFKLITGKKVDDYTLDETLEFEPFYINGSIEAYSDRVATEYNKYNQQKAQLNKDNILTGNSYLDPNYFEYSNYLERKYNADKTLTSIEDATKNMKQSLITSYSSLLNLEQQIKTLEYQIELVQKQVDTLATQQKLGLKTKLEYEKQALSLDKLELNLRTLITNYNKLQAMLEKPWVSMM